jgi:dolichol-phosphate mannosyltransferase
LPGYEYNKAMIYVILPAYNEEKALPLIFASLETVISESKEEMRIIVCNDGSSDSTLKVASSYKDKLPITILDHGVNKGLGRAMRTLMYHIAEIAEPDDVAVAMDADNTHDPKLIPAMRAGINEGADIVIASRYHPDGGEIGLSGIRRILSRGASILLSIFFPIRGARDYTCGYRMYRILKIKQAREIYGDDFITEKNFVCMAEILIKLARIGAKVDEVGMVLRYDLKGGPSKMPFVRTIAKYFLIIWRWGILGGLRKYGRRPAVPD